MSKIEKIQKWYVYGKKADFNQLAKDHGITPVTARIMINRGVQPEDFDEFLYGDTRTEDRKDSGSLSNLNSINDHGGPRNSRNPNDSGSLGDSHSFNDSGSLRNPRGFHDPHDLTDMDLAVDIIYEAINNGSSIRIVGDYDIDGVCATTILTKAIGHLGGRVDYDIPDRIKDGYGINERIINKAAADGVDLIVTCDNGISATEVINKAVGMGISLVITDHHEVPEFLPEADAIVDPKQPEDGYPFKDICGAFVAYKLTVLLYQRAAADNKGHIRADGSGHAASYNDMHADAFGDKCAVSGNAAVDNDLRELMLFASIATVGDVMPLRDENRILVKKGLKLLAETDNTGLNALMDACHIRRDRLSAYTIGFVLGPCINAGGRLSSAKIAMELFATGDEMRALSLASQLKELNDTRKAMTEEYADAAKLQVEKELADDGVLVVYLPECHESVAGIIAGRIKEYYHRPAIVLTDTECEGESVKGSGRSIETYDMYAGLTKVSDLLEKFGGHKMAAGMSLRRDRISDLRKALNSVSGLTSEDFVEKIWIDVALPFAYATAEQAEELELLEPFGQCNDRPVFAQKNVQVLSARTLPGYKNLVMLRLKDETGCVRDGIIFGDAEETLGGLAKKDRIDILYYPKTDNYGGRKNVQLQIKAWK